MTKEEIDKEIDLIISSTPLSELVYCPPVSSHSVYSDNPSELHQALADQTQRKDNIINDLIVKVEDLTRVVNRLSLLIPTAIKYNARSKDFMK